MNQRVIFDTTPYFKETGKVPQGRGLYIFRFDELTMKSAGGVRCLAPNAEGVYPTWRTARKYAREHALEYGFARVSVHAEYPK